MQSVVDRHHVGRQVHGSDVPAEAVGAHHDGAVGGEERLEDLPPVGAEDQGGQDGADVDESDKGKKKGFLPSNCLFSPFSTISVSLSFFELIPQFLRVETNQKSLLTFSVRMPQGLL